MRERTMLLVGLVSMCVVSATALMRLIVVLRIFSRQRAGYRRDSISPGRINGSLTPDSVAPSRILLPSLVFHVLVFLCLATEIPIYTCRYGSTATYRDSDAWFCEVGRPLYALHLTSYLLLFSAFCVIATLWSDVAVFEPTKWTMLMNRSMLILCLLYLLVTGVAVSVCLGLGGVKFFFSSYVFLFFCAYSIAALLLLGSSFLVLGCLLQRRICRVLVNGTCTATITARVVRLNVVMLACFVCFTTRAVMLATLVVAQAQGEKNREFDAGWNRWEWDLRLEWVPHLIPCVAMLYLMRNSGAPDSEAEEDAEDEAAALSEDREDREAGEDRGGGLRLDGKGRSSYGSCGPD